MNDDSNAAPDNSAQAAATPDDSIPPSSDGAQGTPNTPQDQTPDLGAGTVDGGEGDQTPSPAPESTPAPPAPAPFWQQEGFTSEEEFLNAYREGRKTLGKVHRDLADSRRANEIYRQHANNELDADTNIEELIAAENKKAADAAAETDNQQKLANEHAGLAIERFKVKYANLALSDEDVSDIISLAATSQSQDLLVRLEHGLSRLQRRGVAQKQADMKKGADLGPGASGGEKQTDAPDWKGMSSEDFRKYKQKIARG